MEASAFGDRHPVHTDAHGGAISSGPLLLTDTGQGELQKSLMTEHHTGHRRIEADL